MLESIKTLAEFTEVLKNNPKHAYDFIANNSYKLDRMELIAIIKELIYGIYNDCYSPQKEQLFEDIAIELDEQYEEQYQELERGVQIDG